MTYDELIDTCRAGTLPGDPKGVLAALFHDYHARWDEAHTIVQGIPTAVGSQVHAYLHRKEGDLANADYWYRRAGKPRPNVSLEEEWESLARELTR